MADEKGESSKTHKVAPDTKILRDGKPAQLQDLQPGDQVQVTTEQDAAGKAVATEVTAESQPANIEPGPLQDPVQPLPLGDLVPLPDEGPPLLDEGIDPTPLDPSRRQAEATPADHRNKQDALAGLHTFDGEIASFDENKMMVLINKEEKLFLIVADVIIKLDGTEASFKDLQAGHFVTIEAEMVGDELLARSIDARTEKE